MLNTVVQTLTLTKYTWKIVFIGHFEGSLIIVNTSPIMTCLLKLGLSEYVSSNMNNSLCLFENIFLDNV